MWGWWSSSGGEKEDEGGENESGDNDAHDSSQGRDLRASLVEGFGGVWSSFATAAGKVKSVVSDSVGSTFIGDFHREQQKFMQEKKSGRADAAVPPWVGYHEEEAMKTQIMALSSDKRNFLRNPPQGVQFHFDFTTSFPVALATLAEDTKLQSMRFELVPRLISEEMFWRNYFYRVSLIKQSTQLTSLATAAEEQLKKRDSSSSGGRDDDSVAKSREETPDERQHEEEVETFPESAGDEFVSDTFSHHEAAELSQAELGQLGVGDQPETAADAQQNENADEGDWESELQQELQRFGVEGLDDDDDVGHQGKDDETWEAEIEQMLEMDKKTDNSS
ncbi:synapse-associated protein 1-like isoform X2 [Corticium candelabrum]|uniref:synapse-associated protein 1-like isoform X2 n=1 Tax=Corticium candelabrum TaxID=121492 RepID=UPI002E26B31D|nr:synapse-associated protein 1-like isoform X2 [Corticium candelabrum]